MKRIIFDLLPGMEGPEVADLQDGLRLLVERRVIELDEGERQEFLQGLVEEASQTAYHDFTVRLVGTFQRQRGLDETGEVNEKTARRLNEALQSLGAFSEPAGPQLFVVAGQVLDEAGGAYAGLQVTAFHVGDAGLIRLGADQTDAAGRYTIQYPPLPAGQAIFLQVVATDADGATLGESERQRVEQPVQMVNLRASRPPAPEAVRTLEGRVVLDHGAPAEKLTLRLYRREFGGAVTPLEEAVTSPSGDYAFGFDPGPRTVTLEVRAVSATGEETPLSKPLTHMGAAATARVNLVAPAGVLAAAAEYQRLTETLTPHVGDLQALIGAREDETRQDLSELNAVTGWDARVIALAATAQRLQADAEVGLPSEALYGLFRAGLPTDKLMLAQVDPEAIGTALENLARSGIVGLNPDEITAFRERFTIFADKVRLAVPAPGSLTTYGQMLDAAAIGDAGGEFAKVFLGHRGDGAALWKAAREANVEETVISKLQWQGKLAFLAGNSGPVTQHLMKKLDGEPLHAGAASELKGPVELVKQDLYDATQWKTELRGLAANDDELAALIPAAYDGKTVDDRVNAYAEDMARKLRVSYPTEVVTRMVETDTIKVDGAKDATVKLLQEAAPQGFKLGQTPVEAFFLSGAALPEGMADHEVAAAKEEVKKLQRVYQITPNNASMPVLQALGLTSAFDVTSLREEHFYLLFAEKYLELYHKPPTEAEKRLVWRKAQQVSSMTYNLFAVAKKLDSNPALPAISGTPVKRAEQREGLKAALKGYPTMETLFGSMDFCECEHCRSVLSPAAYLVDLLQSIEGEPQAWANFLKRWQERNGVPYTAKFLAPYDALVKRRPDLPHIPLTCENTNIALPYIDIVNEILEYYVANDKLTKDAVRDTGETTTAELLAEPQNVIADAYKQLLREKYPLLLPFDLWLETARQFFDYAETPWAQVLETFRTSEALLPAAPDYGWADIFVESLGLSPAERGIFANSAPLTAWWRLYGYGSKAEALDEAVEEGVRTDINSAKALSRRLGLTYKELVQIVQTFFVNPKLEKLGALYKLPASIAEMRSFFDPTNQAFYTANQDLVGENLDPGQQARLAALSQQEWERLSNLGGFADRVAAYATAFDQPPADVTAELQALPLNDILVLADPEAGCSFDETILRYADATPADDAAFTRINLLVRLWRKLGWTLEETDRALKCFMPAAAPFDPVHSAEKPLDTVLIYLSHLKALDERLRVGKPSRIKLLTLWGDIPTAGKNSLYSQLFLTRSVLKADPIFDHPHGDYLAADWVAKQGQGKPPEFVLVKGHLPAIQGALGLTSGEVAEILADAGRSIETAELTLANLSLLYRYGLLAKALRFSVSDLFTLKALSGRNPFRQLDPTPLTGLDQDYPYVETLRFLEIANAVKESGLKIEELDFLLRGRFDETGPHRQDRFTALTLLKTLADGVRAIQTEHAVPADPGALTEEFLGQKLGLLLAPGNAEQLLRMVRGEEPLQAVARGFFDNALKKQPVRLAGEAGFLEEGDYPDLFSSLTALKQISPNDSPQEVAAKRAENETIIAGNRVELLRRRTRVAAAFLPVLQNRLIRQLLMETLAAETGGEPALVERLVTEDRLLAVQLAGLGEQPLITAYAAAGAAGIDADFYASPDGNGLRQATRLHAASADTELKDKKDADGNDLPAANSARFSGYLAVRATGAYRFYIELEKQDAEARLSFQHLPQPIFLAGMAGPEGGLLGTGAEEYLELKAGVPYRFSLELDQLKGGSGRLLVQGETSARAPLSQLGLYPAAAFEEAANAHTLLGSALLILNTLGLTEREAGYILTHAAGWGNVNLGDLPTARTGDTPAEQAAAVERFGAFLRLAEYARLKRELAGGTDDLIAVFEANETDAADRLENQIYPLIGRLARRDPGLVQGTAEALFVSPGPLAAAPHFPDDRALSRLWDALQVVARLGASATTIQDWTKIMAPPDDPGAPSNAQRHAIARDIKETVKARFDAETWARVAGPIFDRLRRRQRDALVATIMHREQFARLEQLYEYFLVDPGMEPVVQTSRIRLAIGAVQLFVQRCLLNLEREVHPSAIINADQWEWMKHYRVWEANRKIFLFPENWLEPEFRDDKSSLFQELESALMQGDVSADLVDNAFLAYLRKLEELARLDIVAMHLEDKPDFAKNTLHVFGRSFSVPHKYFYRRYANRMWSPWEPIGVEIEGDHLAPVVWRDRLYLFWLTFLENGEPLGAAPVDASKPVPLPTVGRVVEAQIHWSEYADGEWRARESGGYNAPFEKRIRAKVPGDFTPQSVFVHVYVVADPDIDQESVAKLGLAGVYITLGDPINQSFYLASRNSSPEARGATARPQTPFSVESGALKRRPTRYVGAGAKLTVTFSQRISTEPGKSKTEAMDVLGQTGAFTLLPTNNHITLGVSPEAYEDAEKPGEVKQALEQRIAEIEALMKPVFFQDSAQALFVEPEVTERTVEEWQEWVTRTPVPEPAAPGWFLDPKWWDTYVTPVYPKGLLPDLIGPIAKFPFSESLIQPAHNVDWLVNAGTGLLFDGQIIGPNGLAPIDVIPAADLAAATALGAAAVRINAGSSVLPEAAVVMPAASVEAQTGLTQLSQGLNIVGSGGFNAALRQNVEAFTQEGLSGLLGLAGQKR